MRQITSSVTSKGQATIPVEVRRLLGIEPGDKIAFILEEDGVRVARPRSFVAETAGAVKGKYPPPTIDELKEAAARAIAEEAVKRMGG